MNYLYILGVGCDKDEEVIRMFGELIVYEQLLEEYGRKASTIKLPPRVATLPSLLIDDSASDGLVLPIRASKVNLYLIMLLCNYL